MGDVLANPERIFSAGVVLRAKRPVCRKYRSDAKERSRKMVVTQHPAMKRGLSPCAPISVGVSDRVYPHEYGERKTRYIGYPLTGVERGIMRSNPNSVTRFPDKSSLNSRSLDFPDYQHSKKHSWHLLAALTSLIRV